MWQQQFLRTCEEAGRRSRRLPRSGVKLLLGSTTLGTGSGFLLRNARHRRQVLDGFKLLSARTSLLHISSSPASTARQSCRKPLPACPTGAPYGLLKIRALHTQPAASRCLPLRSVLPEPLGPPSSETVVSFRLGITSTLLPWAL